VSASHRGQEERGGQHRVHDQQECKRPNPGVEESHCKRAPPPTCHKRGEAVPARSTDDVQSESDGQHQQNALFPSLDAADREVGVPAFTSAMITKL